MLLQLEKKARAAQSQAALLFVIVNETINLVGYRQGFIWSAGKKKIAAVSGVPAPDSHSPYLQWAKRLATHLQTTAELLPKDVGAHSVPATLQAAWDEFLPPYALWLPLDSPLQGNMGGLLLARDTAFTDAEKTLLAFLAETYAHAWSALDKKGSPFRARLGRRLSGRGLTLAAVLLLAALSFIPVQLTTLGEAEVLPKNPAIVRSPLEGVIDRVLVAPNEQVTAGQTLLELDKRVLASRLLQAEKAREVEKVKLLKTKQLALRDNRSSSQLAIISAMIEEQEAEVHSLQGMLGRATITSPVNGIALFNNRAELVGRPVRIGEKIMTVAAKTESHLVFWLATSDALPLENGARIRLFLNISPNTPIEARLTSIGYTPSPRPEGYMAYRLEAEFVDPAASPRIGLRGVAKIYGQETSLGYLLFRRPLTTLRQWTGL